MNLIPFRDLEIASVSANLGKQEGIAGVWICDIAGSRAANSVLDGAG